MNTSKRFGSIARKIHRSRIWLLLRAMILIDLCLALLCAGGFAYWAETQNGGRIDWRHTFRTVRVSEDVESVQYVFRRPGEDEISAPLWPFAQAASQCGVILLCVEGGYLFLHLLTGRGKARRLLKPIQKVADTAQQLSQPQDERIHHLESALQSVSPGARLRTGDPDLKELEDAVNDLLDKVRASYEEQVRFASDASHELRTPIAVIQGYANMLSRWGKDDPQVLDESVTAIQSEADRMKKLVDQLLFLARGDAGRQKLNLKKTDLCAMLREARDECEMIDPDHPWSLDVPEEPVWCLGDGDMLTQVLRILTDNARKFTPAGGGIRLRAGLKNACPFFEVQDEGEGIAPEQLPRIFDRFFRADPSREGQSGGTGLGLSIAKWIVERHGGYFDVLSRPSIGTRIRIVLPQLPAEEGRV